MLARSGGRRPEFASAPGGGRHVAQAAGRSSSPRSSCVAALVPVFGDPRVDAGHAPAVGPAAAARARAQRGGAHEHARVPGVRDARLARQHLAARRGTTCVPTASRVRQEAGRRVVGAASLPAEVTYALAVVQPGEYLLRARLSGPSGEPVTAEIKPSPGAARSAVASFPPADAHAVGLRRGDPPRPGSLRSPVPAASGLRAQPDRGRPARVQPDRAAGGWKRDRHHDRRKTWP